jgi:hypothetical protein
MCFILFYLMTDSIIQEVASGNVIFISGALDVIHDIIEAVSIYQLVLDLFLRVKKFFWLECSNHSIVFYEFLSIF